MEINRIELVLNENKCILYQGTSYVGRTVLFFSGIPYESYKGFHEWRYQLMSTRYKMEYILGIFEKVPGLLEALGKKLNIYGSIFSCNK